MNKENMWQGLINKYKDRLEIDSSKDIITLSEGNTPLVRARNIEKVINVAGVEIYLKLEGANPSGSFKDRGMTAAITQAIAEGKRTMICASTGNTSASMAAYTAYARSLGYDANCIVLIPDGKVALGKLAQAIAYGSKIVQINGNFDEALTIVRKIAETNDSIALVNSINPARIQGQKTSAFEVSGQLGQAPDILSLPVGNAGNITAYWKGFCEYYNSGDVSSRPQMFGFQAAGAAPLLLGHPVENPETIATAIRIGKPASGEQALQAIKESNGHLDKVTDEEIIEAYKLIHSGLGVTCEPASAASVAGLIKASKLNKIKENSKIVCILTGNGLKDPDTMINVNEFQPVKAEANINAVSEALGI